jgi:hypothetical protein
MVPGWPGGTRAPFCLRRWVFRCDLLLDPFRGSVPDRRRPNIAGTAGFITVVQMQHRAIAYDVARNQDGIHGFKRNQFELCRVWRV